MALLLLLLLDGIFFCESFYGSYLQVSLKRNSNPTTRRTSRTHLGDVRLGTLKLKFIIDPISLFSSKSLDFTLDHGHVRSNFL